MERHRKRLLSLASLALVCAGLALAGALAGVSSNADQAPGWIDKGDASGATRVAAPDSGTGTAPPAEPKRDAPEGTKQDAPAELKRGAPEGTKQDAPAEQKKDAPEGMNRDAPGEAKKDPPGEAKKDAA